MGVETELKFYPVDFSSARRILQNAGGVCQGRRFEENLAYDTPDGSYRARGSLVRLRTMIRDGETLEARVTLKLPLADSAGSRLKSMEELESVVSSPETMRELFGHIGLAVRVRYEKIREKWAVDVGGGKATVCLDMTPFGRFMEIEAKEGVMEACAGLFGFSIDQGCRKTYYELNEEYRKSRGLPPDPNFVFPDETGRRLRQTTDFPRV